MCIAHGIGRAAEARERHGVDCAGQVAEQTLSSCCRAYTEQLLQSIHTEQLFCPPYCVTAMLHVDGM